MTEPTTTSDDGLSYAALKQRLLASPGPVLPPAPSAPSQPFSQSITSLLLPPPLEAALHVLNNDLPAAHFLVRHMEGPPQYEAMMIHGILHRIEGDYDNARAWYRDVKESDIFANVWGSGNSGVEKVLGFVRRVEVLRKVKKGHGDPEEIAALQQESRRELQTVVEFCETKFGNSKVDNASDFWSKSEKSSTQGSNMVVGGEGWRQF